MADVDIVFNHFGPIAEQLPKAASQIIRAAALKIEADAKRLAPVDTGFLKSSIYASTSQGSDYSGTGGALPEVTPSSDQEAIVGVGAEYAQYVEYGTWKMQAQPFLTPAAEAQRQPFLDAMTKLEDKLKP